MESSLLYYKNELERWMRDFFRRNYPYQVNSEAVISYLNNDLDEKSKMRNRALEIMKEEITKILNKIRPRLERIDKEFNAFMNLSQEDIGKMTESQKKDTINRLSLSNSDKEIFDIIQRIIERLHEEKVSPSDYKQIDENMHTVEQDNIIK